MFLCEKGKEFASLRRILNLPFCGYIAQSDLHFGFLSLRTFETTFNRIVRHAEGQPQVVWQTSKSYVSERVCVHQFPVEGDAGSSHCFDNAASLIWLKQNPFYTGEIQTSWNKERAAARDRLFILKS